MCFRVDRAFVHRTSPKYLNIQIMSSVFADPRVKELLNLHRSPKLATEGKTPPSQVQDLVNKYSRLGSNVVSHPTRSSPEKTTDKPADSKPTIPPLKSESVMTRLTALSSNNTAQNVASLVTAIASHPATAALPKQEASQQPVIPTLAEKRAVTQPLSQQNMNKLMNAIDPQAAPLIEDQVAGKHTGTKPLLTLQQQQAISSLPTKSERESALNEIALNTAIQSAQHANMELSKAGITFPMWFFGVQNQSDLVSRSFISLAHIQQPMVMNDSLLQEHLLVSDCIAVLQGCMQTTYLQVSEQNKEYVVTVRKEVATELPATLVAMTQRVLVHAHARFQIVNTIYTHQVPEYGRIANAFSQALRCIIKEYDFYLADLSKKHYGKMQSSAEKGSLSLQTLEVKTKQIHIILENVADLCSRLGVVRGCALLQQLETAVLQSSGLSVKEVFQYLLSESLKPLGRIMDRYINEAVIPDSDAADFFIRKSHSTELAEEQRKTTINTWMQMFKVDDAQVPLFLNNIKTHLCDIGRSTVLLKWKKKQYIDKGPNASGQELLLLSAEASGETTQGLRHGEETVASLVCGDGSTGDLELAHIRLYKQLIDINARVQTKVLDFFINPEYLDFRGHLQNIYAFYLVMAGDFLSCFVESAISELVLSRSVANILRIRSKFKMVIKTSSLANLPYNERMNVIVCPELFKHHLNSVLYPQTYVPDRATDSPDPKVLNLLGLQYDVTYPLNLVLTTPVMERLNLVFRHILRAKVSEIELQKAWTTLQRLRKLERVPHDKIEVYANALRSDKSPIIIFFGVAYKMLITMLDFIHSLQFQYVTILTECIAKFQDTLVNAKSLDDLVSGMSAFANGLIMSLGLVSNNVVNILDTLFNDCIVYSHHIVKTFCIISNEDDEFIRKIVTINEESREGKSGPRGVKGSERMTSLLKKREAIEMTRLIAIANSVYSLIVDNRGLIATLMTKFNKGVASYEQVIRNFDDR